jgi:hypothetical protein
VFNLCSERLYDSSLFEGLVACFPFDDHNCPPLPLLKSFCDSAYDWLKQDMDHMVVVHCKAGKSRTGLMICCLLLYLKVSIHRIRHLGSGIRNFWLGEICLGIGSSFGKGGRVCKSASLRR